MNKRSKHNLALLTKILIYGGVVSIIIFIIMDVYAKGTLQSIALKIMFDQNDRSALGRYDAYERAFGLVSFSSFIGKGTGFISGMEVGSTHNWWLSILVEKGFTGVVFIFLFITLTFKRIMKISNDVKYGILISLIATIIHYNAETGFYFPFIWFIAICAQYEYRSKRFGLNND